ncbi:hypothetical protein CEXT_319171 [Caerostris extrusa]|uniref:Uncharacterized protein n=1 Tax=Caerostris extrusa TaxID=172846 RepID=A0AAV4QG42_CAEEX|nr:hypothetical protein CEXT_319171 [Caerostris extrusa]
MTVKCTVLTFPQESLLHPHAPIHWGPSPPPGPPRKSQCMDGIICGFCTSKSRNLNITDKVRCCVCYPVFVSLPPPPSHLIIIPGVTRNNGVCYWLRILTVQ